MTSTRTPAPAILRRTVRASAAYDLLVTASFALPFTAPLVFAALAVVHDATGWSGSAPTPDPFTILFANLMGSVVVVWSVFRLLRPTRATAVADVAARLLFSLAMVCALVAGVSPVLTILLVLELGWAFVQAAVVLPMAVLRR